MEFIAEIGLNYNNNKGLLSEMVRLAALAGADFAKLQVGWRDQEGEINNLTKYDLNNFMEICSYYEIKPLFSIFHLAAWELIQELKIVNFKTVNTKGKFSDKTIMLTGGFEKMSRSEAKSLVENNGGKVLGTISKKLDMLVTGNSKPTQKKIEAAKKLNVKIIKETDWYKILNL